MKSDGSSRSTNFNDWECRRNEIKAEIENYEIGPKPTRPQNITASYAAGVLTVNVTENGQTLTLTSQISLPTGSGPFPAIIGMNSPSGSVPASVFTSRNVARITFSHNQVTTYGGQRATDPYYRLYPNLTVDNMGQYSAWAWGVSRLIDGLELVQASLPIDLQHIGVTGCSYAGKMALFSGALDERIALTIAQESGGGGAPAWRVSETLGSVEKLGATDYNWFKEDMRQFSGTNVAKLPHDHHELMAMIAPRALLVTGNTDFEWLANPSAYVSARAAHEVWKAFGIGDRFGFYIDGGHNHCAVPATQLPAMEAFVDKFLLGNASVNTDITVHPYPLVNYQRWYQWWGTGNPILPPLPPEPLGKRIWLEAECATVGSSWQTVADTAASNGRYVVVNGLNSTASAPTGAAAAVVMPFTVDSAATYNFVARLNCPSADDDSYWVKVDNGAFVTVNSLGTSGWQWLKLTNATLAVGPHTFTIAYREDGAKFDKLLVTTSVATITGKGAVAPNCNVAGPTTGGFRLNSGGTELSTSLGTFAADQYYSAASAVATTTAPIAGTTEDALYQSERYSTDGQLNYALPVANGTYSVVLHFAETYWTQPGQRVFNIGLEGSTVRTNYDIVAKVGPLTATTETFSVTVTDGMLNLDLVVPYLSGGADQAKLSALEIVPSTGTRGALSTSTKAGATREMSVYPNPAKGSFTVSYFAGKAQTATLHLTDQVGRVVQEQHVGLQQGPNQVPVRLEHTTPGFYQLTLRTADGQLHSQKVVVQP